MVQLNKLLIWTCPVMQLLIRADVFLVSGNHSNALEVEVERNRNQVSIFARTGYPVPVFQIPIAAEPVQDIWQGKSRKFCNSRK